MRKIAAIGVGLAVATFGLTAMAEEPAPAGGGAAAAAPAAGSPGGISVAVLGGMGFKNIDAGTETINVYGPGIGVRGGYTLPGMGVYLGAQFIYHLGASKEPAPGFKFENKIMFYGVEAGYELAMGSITIRPSVHVGQAKFTAKSTISFFGQSQEVDASETRFALSPGATLLYGLGGSLFVGADARYHIVSDANAPAIYATVGAKF